MSTPDALAGLAARLTDPTDREAYAALMLYRDSLPPGDEVRQMLHFFGLLSLIGQRVPVALAEAMTQMRELTNKAGEYYGEIDNRLEGLPAAITKGLDVAGLAKTMGEAFQQQLAATGLEASAAHLRATSADITALTAKLKPLSLEYKGLADSITAGVAALQGQGLRTAEPARSHSWQGHPLLLVVMLMVGLVCGMSWEHFVK